MLLKNVVRWGVVMPVVVVVLLWQQVSPAYSSDLIEVEVSAVGRSLLAHSPAVLLHSKAEGRVLPIFIGDAEAAAIQRYLDGIRMPRPMTHDLIGNLLEVLDGRLERVTVSEFRGSTYFALLQIRVADRVITVDARPSDAIAVALMYGVPIDVARKVMDDQALPYAEDTEPVLPKDRPAAPQDSEGGTERPVWI